MQTKLLPSCAKKMLTDDTKLNIFITFMHINLDAWLQLKTAWGKLQANETSAFNCAKKMLADDTKLDIFLCSQ